MSETGLPGTTPGFGRTLPAAGDATRGGADTVGPSDSGAGVLVVSAARAGGMGSSAGRGHAITTRKARTPPECRICLLSLSG